MAVMLHLLICVVYQKDPNSSLLYRSGEHSSLIVSAICCISVEIPIAM